MLFQIFTVQPFLCLISPLNVLEWWFQCDTQLGHFCNPVRLVELMGTKEQIPTALIGQAVKRINTKCSRRLQLRDHFYFSPLLLKQPKVWYFEQNILCIWIQCECCHTYENEDVGLLDYAPLHFPENMKSSSCFITYACRQCCNTHHGHFFITANFWSCSITGNMFYSALWWFDVVKFVYS